MNPTQELHWKTLKTVIYDQTGCQPDAITPEARLIDLGFDSLDNMELVLAIEEEWEIVIPSEDSERWESENGTVQMILDYLEEFADLPAVEPNEARAGEG